jgi:hypothetical protein
MKKIRCSIKFLFLLFPASLFAPLIMAAELEIYGYCYAIPGGSNMLFISSVFNPGDQWNHGAWKDDFDAYLDKNVQNGNYHNNGMCLKFDNNYRDGNYSDALNGQKEAKRQWSRKGYEVREIGWKP